jgi:hypothetical protein
MSGGLAYRFERRESASPICPQMAGVGEYARARRGARRSIRREADHLGGARARLIRGLHNTTPDSLTHPAPRRRSFGQLLARLLVEHVRGMSFRPILVAPRA